VPHVLRVGLMTVVMVLAACTATSPEDFPGEDGAAPPAANDSPTMPTERGWLAIDLRYEPGRASLSVTRHRPDGPTRATTNRLAPPPIMVAE
jgi:predicted small lipoprotein YifL